MPRTFARIVSVDDDGAETVLVDTRERPGAALVVLQAVELLPPKEGEKYERRKATGHFTATIVWHEPEKE